jgi:polysaccharide deacetylase 2 family uncharacterized protein YibQ
MNGGSGVNRFYLTTFFLLVARICWGDADTAIGVGLENPSAERVRIALIIDDLGYVRQPGQRVVALNGPVACAILPHTPYAESIAREAKLAGKEVMLHLPLQAVAEFEATGLGTIKIDTTEAQLVRIFDANIDSIPHVVGVNNHMGSMLTQHPGHMNWLMGALKARGNLFFVDSYTSDASVALQMAREHGVPATRRDVFLDNVQTHTAVAREFQRLITLARKHGSAVGIGHPYPVTLNFLENMLPRLPSQGIDVVPVRELISGKRTAMKAELAKN